MKECLFHEDREKHTIEAIHIIAGIRANMISPEGYSQFQDLYREIYPLICNVDESDISEDDSKEVKKIYGILLKQPDKITYQDKTYFINHFNIFLNLFGVWE